MNVSHQLPIRIFYRMPFSIGIAQRVFEVTKTERKHFDLIKAIHDAIRISSLTWKFRHVKGHQDDEYEYEELDIWGKLNVRADDNAKGKMDELLDPNNPLKHTTRIGNEAITILWQHPRKLNQVKIGSKLKSTLTKLIHGDTIRQYWIKSRKKFSADDESRIDWKSFNRAASGADTSRKKWLSKWLSECCGVGRMNLRRGWRKYDNCPRCGQANETVEHVMACPQVEARATWTEAIGELRNWMDKNESEPEMTVTICSTLEAWGNSQSLP